MLPVESIVLEDSTNNNQFTCRRNDNTEIMRFYFTPYINGIEREDPLFETGGSRPGANSPWTVTPPEENALEYTLTINPVTMDLNEDSEVTAGSYR